jgi:hypothetical protein
MITAFWDVGPYSIVEADQRLKGSYCLHSKGDCGSHSSNIFGIDFTFTKIG